MKLRGFRQRVHTSPPLAQHSKGVNHPRYPFSGQSGFENSRGLCFLEMNKVFWVRVRVRVRVR